MKPETVRKIAARLGSMVVGGRKVEGEELVKCLLEMPADDLCSIAEDLILLDLCGADPILKWMDLEANAQKPNNS